LRVSLRAAALAAAAFVLCTTAGFAPSVASETDASPVVSYAAHADTSLSAEDLGLNDFESAIVPAADPAESQVPAPTAVHEAAPVMPGPATDAEEAEDVPEARRGRSLAQLVADHAATTTPDAEAECLARAVYFESKGEPLAGQLSVAEVIINRSQSRRFPSTICGVVRQPSQFSFVRRGYIPQPPSNSQWRTAVAIARIALADLADGGAPRALFFHARHVSPRWRLTRVATVGNHVFYR
jgi:spore germination cell wall hydrolase CwlJ-like protein